MIRPKNSTKQKIVPMVANQKLELIGAFPLYVSLMLIVPQRIINRKVPSRKVKIALKNISSSYRLEYDLTLLQLTGHLAKTVNRRMKAI